MNDLFAPKGGTIDAGRRRVAHEIRNSLGAIRSATELLQRHYDPRDRQLRLFNVLLTEVDRLAEITDEELGPPKS
jgi:nitrogen-specific signal transduction histidine kinase